MRKTILFSFLFLLPSCASSAVDSDAAEGAEFDDLHSEPRGDVMTMGGPPQDLTASVDGLSLSVAPIAAVQQVDGVTVWRFEGRASDDLSSVASWVPDDAFGEAVLTGPRTFSIAFREPSDQNTIVSGLPVFVTLTPTVGAPAEAAIWFRPRLKAGAGSGRIRFYAIVKPIWLAGDVVYRGKMAVDPSRDADWDLSIVSAPAPRQTALGAGKTRLDWAFDTLAATVAHQPALVRAQGRRGTALIERTAELEIRAIRLGLTRQDPRDRWPHLCKDSVRTCLAGLSPGEIDTESCGTYREVLACGGLAEASGAH
jgi:hypothetical protein